MPDMSAIENTPEISFIDNKTVEDVRSEMVADYEEYMTQAQGVTVSLDRASVHRMILYAAAAQIYQAMQYIDRQGKQSLLKYSSSDYLDNLALFKGVTRSPATAATCTLRFTLAAVAQAVEDYKVWQRAIGRDINPSKLVAMVMEAGAKRVTVTAPAYTAVAATKVSALQGEATVTYGGLEDD